MDDSNNTFYLMSVRASYIYYLIGICIAIFLYWGSIFAVVIFLLSQLIYIEARGLKIEVCNDTLIIYKIFGKEKIIPFNSIESVTRGQSTFYWYIGAWRDYLIIPYTEPSGYKCEFTDLYNEEMHICIDRNFSAYKKLKKS